MCNKWPVTWQLWKQFQTTPLFITRGDLNGDAVLDQIVRETGEEEAAKIMQAGKNVVASAKEKVSNMASTAKEHVDIYKANVQEKAEKAAARDKMEKEIAHERKEAKVAEAKRNKHAAKAVHLAEKENAKHPHGIGTHGDVAGVHGNLTHQPAAGAVPTAPATALPTAGTTIPTAGNMAPVYPPPGNPATGNYP